jgi:hypothetical protein
LGGKPRKFNGRGKTRKKTRGKRKLAKPEAMIKFKF